MVAEDVTNRGRIDLSIIVDEHIYILEFKVVSKKDGNKNIALEQIREKRYYEKYLQYNKPITFIGVLFGEEDRNICGFEWELVDSDK